VPAAQGEHDVAEPPPEKLPAAHAAHWLFPPLKWCPPEQLSQLWSVVFVHVSTVQLSITVQLVQARSVVAVQVALICSPAGQAPEHWWHVPLSR